MHTKFIVVALSGLTLASAVMAADSVVVPPVADPYKTGLSIEVISQDTWTGAEAYAESAGGFLMSIHSSAENAWIVSTFLTAHSGGSNTDLSDLPVWLGFYDPQPGSDANHAANFLWSDGTAADYTNFYPGTGEPNNYMGGGQTAGEHYTAINWHYVDNQGASSLGTWDDTPNEGTYPGVGDAAATGIYYGLVEISAVPTPFSSTLLIPMVTAVMGMRRKKAPQA